MIGQLLLGFGCLFCLIGFLILIIPFLPFKRAGWGLFVVGGVLLIVYFFAPGIIIALGGFALMTTQPVPGRFTRAEVARIDEAVKAFPSNFATRADLVRYSVLSMLGNLRSSLAAEKDPMPNARVGLFTTPSSDDHTEKDNSAPAAAGKVTRASLLPEKEGGLPTSDSEAPRCKLGGK